MRLYFNYRRLNKITIKNRYLLLLVSELFNRLSYAKIFIKLDLCNMYYRIYIKKGDEQKTIFKIRYTHFKYLVMPFSFTNTSITFQSYIYKALGTLVDTIYIVYLDNILIYLNNKDKHVKHVKQILQQLRAQGLYTKLLKYIFYTKNVKFLGLIITLGGIIIDPNRVKAIKEQPKPKSYKDIQVFLSFANFYTRFIQNYLDTVYPLYIYLIQVYYNLILDKEKKQKRKLKGPTRQY